MTTSASSTPASPETLPVQSTTGFQEIALLAFARVIVLSIGTVGQAILAYVLLPEGRGVYAICVIFGTLCSIVFTLGVDRGSQYFIMSRQMTLSQAVSTAYTICFVGSAVAVVVSIPMIHSGISYFESADRSSLYLSLLLIPTLAVSLVANRQLSALRRFMRLSVFNFIQSALVVVAVVACVSWLRLGVNGAIFSLLIGHLIFILACMVDLRRNCGLTFAIPDSTGLRLVLHYGMREYLARLGQSIDVRLGALLLGFLASSSEVAFVAVGSALITRIAVLPRAIAMYLLPRVAGDTSGRPELVAFCTRTALWTTGGMLIAWIVLSPTVVPLVLSEAFMPVVRLTWIMSLGVCAGACAEVLSSYFRGVNRPEIGSFGIWIGIVTNAGLVFALYPPLGIDGAAWAMVGGMLVRGAFLTYVFHSQTRLHPSATLILKFRDVIRLWRGSWRLLHRVSQRPPGQERAR